MQKILLTLKNTGQVVVFLALIFPLLIEAQDKPYIPEQLKPWERWVLHDKKEQLECIPQHDDSGSFHCSWPSELQLVLDNKGGSFRQVWWVQSQRWVSLPGSGHKWPVDVTVDGKRAVVLEKDGGPKVQMPKGAHEIIGSFRWPKLPENIIVPPRSGLVSLQVNGKVIAFPNLDSTGRLWFKNDQPEEKIENRIKIDSYRLIDDSIPARITLHFNLDVSGSAREITLGPLYDVANFTPLSLRSKLPARLEQNGKLLIQVRPGRYTFTLSLRHSGPLKELKALKVTDKLWPEEEIWSFRARPELRLVEITGGTPMDPMQTSVPKQWRNLPAHRVMPGEGLSFKEIKRGDPQPAPDQLTLSRVLWLRFDGAGYSIKDTITGKKNTNWRLEMDPVIGLGRVAVDGTERFITRRHGADKAGVELRNGEVNIIADSLYLGDISNLLATGWSHDFQKVTGKLYLPPGWKLVAARGIDNISKTWMKKWTLLDLFIVLIFTIAMARLYSRPLAFISFLTLVLVYHEPDAPRYIWLALLLGIALLKYLPGGVFRNIIKGYQVLMILLLIGIALPYSIQALRIGIYPQLERPWSSIGDYSRHDDGEEVFAGDSAELPQTVSKRSVPQQERRPMAQEMTGMAIGDSSWKKKQLHVMQYDPKTVNQTGPGLPKWQPFETIPYSWSGPVTQDQTVAFTLIGPKSNLVLAFVRVALIIVLGLGMVGVRYRPKGGFSLSKIHSVMAILLLAIFLNHDRGHCAEIPSQMVLDELQSRLMEESECFPSCADISEVIIVVEPDELSIEATVNAGLEAAVPLPSHVKHWIPAQVLIDGAPAQGIMRKDDNLWIAVPEGIHRLELSGPLRRQNTLQLPFPLKPHRATVRAEGWSVEGLRGDGSFDSQLQFKRVAVQKEGQSEILETGILPSFVQVKRTLLLGLVWKIETRVKRMSPLGSAVVVDIPLVPGESVTSQGVHVQDGVAKINLSSSQREMVWESFLEPSAIIELEHTKTDKWTEIWTVDVSPIFHMEYDGIPVIHHKNGSRWFPTWHPWPGEKVVLNISRPSGVAGQTMTVEKSHLLLTPGQRTTAATLSLTIKSSQGGQHTILLPAGSKLQEVKINEKVHPIRQKGDRLTLPIVPAKQKIVLKWIENRGMSTHYKSSMVDLGIPSVNTGVDIHLPENRWPLFIGGDQLVGPAVLFWSVVIMIILVAFGLSRTGLTPLRFYHWVLLGIGMAMTDLVTAMCLVGWLLVLDLREKANDLKDGIFNLVQIGVVFMTLIGVAALVFAISNGLLGHPDMNIVGNGSNSNLLRWYHDVSPSLLPQAWVFSIPMLTYRVAMLLWALWVSFWLVGILKWGWLRFVTPSLWKKSENKKKTIIEIDSEE